MDILQLCTSLCQAPGVPGCEQGVLDIAQQLAVPLGEVKTAGAGSLLLTVVSPKQVGPHILLDAHADRVGLTVTHITDDGFVRLTPVGGVDQRLCPAARIQILTDTGVVPGTISALAPHLSGLDKKDIPPIEEMIADVGLTPEQAKQQIAPGDVAQFVGPVRPIQGDNIVGAALDDRVGIAALLLCAKQIKDSGFDDCGVNFCFTCGEEVGGTGAKTTAYQVGASVCAAIDVTFAMSHGCDDKGCCTLGAGPAVGLAPQLDRNIYKGLLACAKAKGIPCQQEIMGGKTGTNADQMGTAGLGAKLSVISIPQRYMHSYGEVCNINDIQNTARLLAAAIQEGVFLQ